MKEEESGIMESLGTIGRICAAGSTFRLNLWRVLGPYDMTVWEIRQAACLLIER